MQRLLLHCLAAAGVFRLAAPAQDSPPPVSAPAAPHFTVSEALELDPGTIAFAPKWSPDGTWIAFSFPKANGIGLIRPDGTGQRTLTSEPGSGYRFAWSPDGTRIAFRQERRDLGARNYIISVADVAAGKIESSTAVIKDVQPPVWQTGPEGLRWITCGPSGAVDGSWFKSSSPAYRQKQKSPLTEAASTPGPRLIEQRGVELWFHHPDPAKRWKLSGDFGLNPAWSPDGSRLVYDAMDRFAVLTPDSAEPPRAPVVGLNPAWSPDGGWLAYQITRDHSHTAEDQRRHTADTAPHAHSDKTNHRIVDSEIWIIRADGRDRHQLTNTPDILESDPDWSPDGRAVVCRTEETGKIRILKLAAP